MLTPTQLKNHQSHITASKIGAVLGKDEKCSKYELFARMKGKLAPIEENIFNGQLHGGCD